MAGGWCWEPEGYGARGDVTLGNSEVIPTSQTPGYDLGKDTPFGAFQSPWSLSQAGTFMHCTACPIWMVDLMATFKEEH